MLGGVLAAELPLLRAQAESMMLDAGRALRPAGEMVYDPATQAETRVEDEIFASGCKIQSTTLVDPSREVGGRSAVSVRLSLHLPASTEPLQVGDEWEIVEPGPLSSVPAGRRYRIEAPFEKSLATARRYGVAEVVT